MPENPALTIPALSPVAPAPQETYLLTPVHDVAEPELSIVIPALNEELTIADFVAWCHEGLAKAGVRRRDPDRRQLERPHPRARAGRAAPACCETPKRGLGRAYIDALPFIRGK